MTGRQVWTWVEIPVVGLGWVVVDPTPDATTSLSAPPPDAAQAAPPPLRPPGPDVLGTPASSGSHPLAPAVAPLRRPFGTGDQIAEASLALLVALAAAALAVPLQASLRRRRRRLARSSGDPASVAVGAWLELLDGLWRAGMSTNPAATSSEVAAEAARHFGSRLATPVATLGAAVDRALFGPRAGTDRVEAERAWWMQVSITQQALSTLDRRQRLRAFLRVGRSPATP